MYIYKCIIIALAICPLFSNCTSNEGLPINKVITIDSICDINNELYFQRGTHLTSINNELFFIDIEKNKIIKLSHELLLKKSWGSSGRGTNEFICLLGLNCSDRIITVYDAGRKALIDFDHDGNLLAHRLLRDDALLLKGEYRFIQQDTCIYGCGYSFNNSLITINQDQHTTMMWGEIFNFTSAKQQSIRNDRHLLKYDQYYFAISDNMPHIEKYDNTCNIISKFDLSSLEEIADELKFIKSKDIADNSYYNLISDCYLYDDDLYLLLKNYKNGYASNRILQINLKDGFNPIRYIQLSDRIYSSICVNHKGVYAINSRNSTIKLYQVL